MSIEQWAAPPVVRSARDFLIERFATAVAANPARLAVAGGGRSLTYAALDDASDKLASLLRQLGVCEGALVGVMSDRSVDVVVAYLAILKANAAFMPLSPDVPAHRNILILNNSRADLCLTNAAAFAGQEAVADYLQAAHLLDIDTHAGIGRRPAIDRSATPPGVAYVIHTSGSTGTPKGTVNTDAGLLNLVAGLAEKVYPASQLALNIALVAPFVFDPSIQQIFGALLQGHSLFIVPEAARFDGGALLSFLNAHDIDLADGTPTHLRLLANAPASLGNRLSPSRLLIGGEALTVDNVRTFWARFGGQKAISIVNLYGTAECTVDSTFHFADREEMDRLGFVPIGHSLPGVDVALLDENAAVVPDGNIGEIAIGGVSVGLGYLGQPGMTRQKFLTGDDGQTYYLTGDLGRMHPDGLLQCLGRRDRQLKIRGVRIEPVEIELALRSFRRSDTGRSVLSCDACLLDTRHPGVVVEDGLCSVCRQFETYRDAAARYFADEARFRTLMDDARTERSGGEFDCLLLYSGGKDSSYVLLRLIELGYRVATFTFDNGYISETALNNIERTTRAYGGIRMSPRRWRR